MTRAQKEDIKERVCCVKGSSCARWRYGHCYVNECAEMNILLGHCYANECAEMNILLVLRRPHYCYEFPLFWKAVFLQESHWSKNAHAHTDTHTWMHTHTNTHTHHTKPVFFISPVRKLPDSWMPNMKTTTESTTCAVSAHYFCLLYVL